MGVGYIKDIKSLDYKLIDIQRAFTEEIEPHVTEDVFKYNLEKNNRLLRRFIVYRVVSFILDTLGNNVSCGKKLLLFIPKELQAEHIGDNQLFVINLFRKLSAILSLSIYADDMGFIEFVDLLTAATGEGREARARVNFVYARHLKRPDLVKLDKFLLKNGIQKIQGELNSNFKVKLGLFLT